MKRGITTIILILLILSKLHVFCTKKRICEAILLWADSLMAVHPDSTLHILGSISTDSLSTKADRAYHALLLTQARDKNYIVQTDDSLIRTEVHYYDAHGDAAMQARAYYLLGSVYRDMNRCEKAITEQQIMPKRGKRGFVRTHIQQCGIYL